MRRFIFFIFYLFPTFSFSQTIDIRIPTTTNGGTDSLGGKGAAFYVDTLNKQNISGLKTFKNDILIDATGIGIGLNGVLPTVPLDVISIATRAFIIKNTGGSQSGFIIGDADIVDEWQFIADINNANIFRLNHQNTSGDFLDVLKITHTGINTGIFEIPEGDFKVTSGNSLLGSITTGTWDANTIAVNKGGTGQASYINGQLLIGNTTGNTLTKTTLTGTTNQVNIVNGGGSITLSTPQNIHTTATPTFGSLLLGINPATTGTIRLPNASPIKWRNAANNGDINAFTINGSNQIVLGAASGGWDAVRIANDASLKLGFFAVTPITRASTTSDIKDALTSYGLLQGTSATALNLDGGDLTADNVIGTATGGGSVAAIRAVSTGPGIEIRQTDAAVNEKSWDILAGGGQLLFRTVNDANNAANSWVTIDRTGIVIDQITFGGHIEAHKTIQSGEASFGGSTWRTVTFPVAFPAGTVPRVTANDASGNNSRFSVSIRNESNVNFQYLPLNIAAQNGGSLNNVTAIGGVHTGADAINWIAVVDN